MKKTACFFKIRKMDFIDINKGRDATDLSVC